MILQSEFDILEIENLEKDLLFKFAWLFKHSLEEFSTSVDRSLGYLDKIALPIIMASKQDKSYNPFSEIIEKFVIHILIKKLEKEGYKLLPLGYSADLTLENSDHILSIDVKTANIDNPSDFKKTIPIGINQTTHAAKLRLNRRDAFPRPYYVYPTIPPFYRLPDGTPKLILTYGLMFIYPSYKSLIDDVRKDYSEILDFFIKKIKKIFVPIIVNSFQVSERQASYILENKPREARYTRKELIAESLIRGFFIHGQQTNEIKEALKIDDEDMKIIKEFESHINDFVNKIRNKDIKPIAIIAISIPNGLLIDYYIDRFVSGKNWSKSARYHYKDGIFKIIKEKTKGAFPRVLFVDLNRNSVDDLKRHFKNITILDYSLKRL